MRGEKFLGKNFPPHLDLPWWRQLRRDAPHHRAPVPNLRVVCIRTWSSSPLFSGEKLKLESNRNPLNHKISFLSQNIMHRQKQPVTAVGAEEDVTEVLDSKNSRDFATCWSICFLNLSNSSPSTHPNPSTCEFDVGFNLCFQLQMRRAFIAFAYGACTSCGPGRLQLQYDMSYRRWSEGTAYPLSAWARFFHYSCLKRLFLLCLGGSCYHSHLSDLAPSRMLALSLLLFYSRRPCWPPQKAQCLSNLLAMRQFGGRRVTV